jgi:hypothetical protein
MPFYCGTPSHIEKYICPCGYQFSFETADFRKAEEKTDLLIRLHKKKCALAREGDQQTHSLTTSETDQTKGRYQNKKFKGVAQLTTSPTQVVDALLKIAEKKPFLTTCGVGK